MLPYVKSVGVPKWRSGVGETLHVAVGWSGSNFTSRNYFSARS